MPYDHSRKAGNRGDVWKHFVLVALADAIPHGAKGSGSFRYVESHAGAPFHGLANNREWRDGVGRIIRSAAGDSPYVAHAREWLCSQQYPAGWVFVAERLARRQFNVETTLFDKSDAVAKRYRPQPDARVPANVKVRFRHQDGYSGTEALYAADADFVFLDPPYHRQDWRRLGKVCRTLGTRGVTFAAWYPVFASGPPQKLSDSTGYTGWEVVWPKKDSPAPNYNIDRMPVQELKGCGMLVSDTLSELLPDIKIKGRLSGFAARLGWKFSIRHPAG